MAVLKAEREKEKAEMVVLRAEKEALEKEKESHEEEIKRERERNGIAYATWLDAKSALEAKLKKS